MKELVVQIGLLLLLSISAPVPASSLVGSCVEAGFTDCCDPEQGPCYVLPTFCLCEPSCHLHNDCCDDINEICIPDYLKPALPVVLLSVNITFHTATLLWGIPAEAGDNDVYKVFYWEYDNPNDTLVHNTTVVSAVCDKILQTTVTGLQPGALYLWGVEVKNSVTSSRSVMSNFTMMSYTKLEEFHVHLYNASAVLVSWLPLQLPYGVQLQEYVVHYSQTRTTAHSIPHTGNKTMPGNYGVVGGLSSGTYYHFWVEARVLEMDGTQPATVVSAPNATMFVPDTAIVQLRGGPFKPCHRWTKDTERQVLDTFRRVIQQTIHSDRDCSIQRGGVIQNDLLICESSITSSKESRAVYRATVYTSPNHTAQIISSLIEKQVVAGEFSDELTDFEVDTACPVGLRMGSEPLCTDDPDLIKQPVECPKADSSSKDSPSTSSTSSCGDSEAAVVTLPVLVAILIVELLLIVSLMMVAVAVVMVVRRRRFLADEKASQDTHHADPNVYS